MFVKAGIHKVFVDVRERKLYDMDLKPVPPIVEDKLTNQIKLGSLGIAHNLESYTGDDVLQLKPYQVEDETAIMTGYLLRGKNRMHLIDAENNYRFSIGSNARKVRSTKNINIGDTVYPVKYDFDFFIKPTILNLIGMCRSIGPLLFPSDKLPKVIGFNTAAGWYNYMMRDEYLALKINLMMGCIFETTFGGTDKQIRIDVDTVWLSDDNETFYGMKRDEILSERMPDGQPFGEKRWENMVSVEEARHIKDLAHILAHGLFSSHKMIRLMYQARVLEPVIANNIGDL